jgi:Flp pilus assembly protein TadD
MVYRNPVDPLDNQDAVQEFREGLSLLGSNFASEAVPHFTKAVELNKQNPFYLSYLGVAIAASEKKWEDAEARCYEALRMKRSQPELYLNLSKVYVLAGKRKDAVDTLLEGLPLTRRDARIVKALRRFGVRQAPVLRFLDRTHPVNRELGKIRYRVLKSLGKEV